MAVFEWLPMLSLSELTEQAFSSLLNLYLSDHEKCEIKRYFRNRNRQVQYLLARKITKKLYFDQFDDKSNPNVRDFKGISIRNELDGITKGKPTLYNGNNISDPSSTISITHTDGYVGSSLGRNCMVGFDIECIENVSTSFLETAFSSMEISLLEKYPLPYSLDERASFFWAIKESIVKALGTGFRFGLKSVQISIESLNYITATFSDDFKNVLNLEERSMHLEYRMERGTCFAFCIVK